MPTAASAQAGDVPYWASLDDDVVYMRVGPSERYKIDWVYQRDGLPVKVVRLMQGWRLVQDPDGDQGWILGTLLSRQRHAIVIGEEATAMRAEPSVDAEIRWNVEPGVVGALGDCSDGWCELDVDGREGWVLEDRLWGAGEP
ncbi:SH3 domain-containing protein [Alteraurantiacibacter aestuarii]|uniref:SH3 domain-containing protein n=1 Tax=Alteraurantiacibacter aestuarii TaxID=650004 RepID=UPI0031DB9368